VVSGRPLLRQSWSCSQSRYRGLDHIGVVLEHLVVLVPAHEAKLGCELSQGATTLRTDFGYTDFMAAQLRDDGKGSGLFGHGILEEFPAVVLAGLEGSYLLLGEHSRIHTSVLVLVVATVFVAATAAATEWVP